MPRPTRSSYAALCALLALSFATRLPALLNAAGTNSDAAVVGLEARHILQGAWEPYLWGSGYQTSADSTWAALVFAVIGPTPLALMLSALVLYVGLTLLVFFSLRRRLEPWGAFVATLPLVFTTACVHSYALYPPRQLALTLAFAGLFVLDGAAGARRARVSLAAGGALSALAVVADPYASILVPAAVLLAGAAAFATPSPRRALGAFAFGAALGAAPFAWLLTRHEAKHGVVEMSTTVLAHNARLLWHECLPWALGTKVYAPLHAMDYVEWKMPATYAVAAYTGAVALALALVLAARAPTRLAAAAWLTIFLNFASFLVSRMVMDRFSMRYLAASVLVLPFALAPVVVRLGAWRAGALLAPYLFAAGAGGWLAHGPWVSGPLPRRVETGAAEGRLLRALERRGVEGVVADYWAAYRLDFLWREALPVAPYHVEQDRYPPYRTEVAAAKRFAYVYDRSRSFEDEAAAARELAAGGHVSERFTEDGFAVVVIDRSVSTLRSR